MKKTSNMLFFCLYLVQRPFHCSPIYWHRKKCQKHHYILKVLRDFYVPNKNVLSERYSFRALKQLNGESLSKYVAPLKGLASTCKFVASLEEQLRDQLVYRICSKDFQARLLSAAYGEPLTWPKLLDIVNNFECTVMSLNAFQHTPLRTDSVSYAKPARENPGVEEKTREKQLRKGRANPLLPVSGKRTCYV